MTKSYDPEGNTGIGGVQEEFRESEMEGNDMADELVEAVARAMCEYDVCDADDPKGRAATEWEADSRYYIGFARVALETAARLSRPSTAEAVAVKPLEWEDYGGKRYFADTVVGKYTIIRHGNHFALVGPEDSFDGFGYPVEGPASHCKDAAQADYENRIRSALTHPSPQGGEEPTPTPNSRATQYPNVPLDELAARYPEVLAAHAQFGGDLKDMLRRYEDNSALRAAQRQIDRNGS